MSPLNIVSLSHSDDFDGIGSQAILHRYFVELKKPIPERFGDFSDKEVRIHFFQADYQDYLFYWAAIIAGFKTKNSINPEDFSLELRSTTLKLHNASDMDELRRKFKTTGDVARNRIYLSEEIWKNMDLLILSDIGYNKTFKPLFRMLEELNIPIVYFDHHEHDEDTTRFLSKYCRVYEINEALCTTQLVHRFFLLGDKTSKFIGDLGADTDFEKYEMRTSKEIMSLISYYRKNPCMLHKIIENYSLGINLDSYLKQEYNTINKWETEAAKRMLDSIREIPLFINEKKHVRVFLGISSLRSGRSMKHLYTAVKNGMFSGKPGETILLLTIDEQSLNTNIKSDHVDVHKIAEHFGGGGHKKRAGFRFPSIHVKNGEITHITLDDLRLEEFLEEFKKFL